MHLSFSKDERKAHARDLAIWPSERNTIAIMQTRLLSEDSEAFLLYRQQFHMLGDFAPFECVRLMDTECYDGIDFIE